MKLNLEKLSLNFFNKFEKWIAIFLSVIIACIIIVSLIRLLHNFYELFIVETINPQNITFEDYQQLFGKVLTLLISLEFMSSIINVLKTHNMKSLVTDVLMIVVLAVSRKLIVYDYDHHEASSIMAIALLIVSLGVTYFLFKFNNKD
jgi:uncharacterized membrane protein (DUF373 family)